MYSIQTDLFQFEIFFFLITDKIGCPTFMSNLCFSYHIYAIYFLNVIMYDLLEIHQEGLLKRFSVRRIFHFA